jgi:hypothetical protein
MITKFIKYNENKKLSEDDIVIFHYGIVPEHRTPNPTLKPYDKKPATILVADYSEYPTVIGSPFLIRFIEDGKKAWVNRESITPHNPKIIVSPIDPYGEEDWSVDDEDIIKEKLNFFKKKKKAEHDFSVHTEVNFIPRNDGVYYFQAGLNRINDHMGIGEDQFGKKCKIVRIYDGYYEIKFDNLKYSYTCRIDNLLPLDFSKHIERRKEMLNLHKDEDPYGEEVWESNSENIIYID